MMKYISTLLIVLNLILTRSSHSNEDVKEKVAMLMKECQNSDLFSGTVLVAKDGQVIFKESYGFADKEKGISNTNTTKYNIGSIGKDFTAIMVLQLIQEKKINLGDNLGMYLNFFPDEISNKVTIKNLLNHSSGFGDYTQNPEFHNDIEKYKELSDLLKLIAKEELEFAPGTNDRYSNSGYAILGVIIESITGKSYQQNLRERITEPLEMNSTGYIFWEDNDPLKAIGYIKDIKGNVNDNKNLRLQPSPAGGMYSVVDDLLKLDQSLMNDNKVLSDKFKLILLNHYEESNDTLFENWKTNPNTGNAYAGGAPGINALYLQYPAKGYTAIILANYDHAAESLEEMITDIIQGREYKKPKLPLGQELYRILQKEGINNFAVNMKNTIRDNKHKIHGARTLNNIGYQFLNNDMPEAAIEVFKLNVEMFPEIANGYDSLGEAYLIVGNILEAKKNFEQVLELDPGNERAKMMLQKIE